MCESASAISSSPLRALTAIPIRLPIVPLGTKVADSLPIRRAATFRRRFAGGSSPKTSSPRSALAAAARISAEGMATVSERRSIAATRLLYWRLRAELILAGGRIRTLRRSGLPARTHPAIASGRVLAAGGSGVMGLPGPRARCRGLGGAARAPGLNGADAAVGHPPPDRGRRADAILLSQRLLLSRGVTSVGAAVNRGFADDLLCYQRLAEDGRLQMRVNQFLSWELLEAASGLGVRAGFGGAIVRAGPIKVFVDGGAER